MSSVLLPAASPIFPKCRFAIVGDVHDQWQPEQDYAALTRLDVDFVLFVGDFGNEALDLVRTIAQMPLPKALIFGNHDAWYTATESGRRKCPYDKTKEDRVQAQMDLVGAAHVGYGYLDLPEFNVSIVGGRPFSWGGPQWKQEAFYHQRFGVHDFTESAQHILNAIERCQCEQIILLSHNGPSGLGNTEDSICGKDWKKTAGDYGDPDLAMALEQFYARQTYTEQTSNQDGNKHRKNIILNTFGHMHHQLRLQQKQRQRLVMNPQNTIFLNAACVPRLVAQPDGTYRNFSIVELDQGKITSAALVWLDPNLEIFSHEVLFTSHHDHGDLLVSSNFLS
ncbi:MAG: TIGR04168 family protein [Pseudanabaenaceae cyanobacterium]